MLNARAPRLSTAMAVVAAIVALLVLADVVVVTRLVATRFTAPQASTSTSTGQQKAKSHPCNHGFYVSQAAHAKKGAGYVSGIAQSSLGKNGNCSAPPPAKAATPASPKTSDDTSDDQ